MFNRRKFLGVHLVGIFGILPYHFTKFSRSKNENINLGFGPIDRLYPTTNHEEVRAIVGAAHARFDKVKELLNDKPELAKATWDWGFGDWESALGAASHMGRRDIAELLIAHGARPNIFTFAMLGKLEAVQQMVEQMPGVQAIPGPHGISLLSHAQMRLKRDNVEGEEKDQQEALVEYLENLGDANPQATSLDISKEEQQAYLGKYSFGSGEDEYFEVSLNSRGMLFISRGSYTGRVLLRTGTSSFAPGGAPSVQINFNMVADQAKSFKIHDPIPILEATRIG